MTKAWYLSKTVWVNLVLGLVTVFSAIYPHATVVSEWINANTALIGTIWGALGVGLRFVSHGKIQISDS